MDDSLYIQDNNPERKPPKPKKFKMPKLPKMRKPIKKTTLILIAIVLFFGTLVLNKIGIKVCTNALEKSYSDTYEAEKNNAYDKIHEFAYNQALEKYHLQNTVAISIGDSKETQKLEVLTANDVEFITEDRNNNSGNVTAWLEVEGEGTYVVDLSAAEYIIDNTRQYVLVRAPKPELTNINIIRTTRKLFSDDWADGSFSEGVELALKQRNEAMLRIEKSLMSNQNIYDNAKNVAISTIQNFVKQLNPDARMLTVEVEFMQ